MIREMRLFGGPAPDINRLRRRSDLRGLRRAVDYRDRSLDSAGVPRDSGVVIRVQALQALSEFFGPEVVDGVTAGLADGYPQVRKAAVDASERAGLGELADRLVRGLAEWDDPPFGESIRAARAVLEGWETTGLPERLARELVESDVELDDRRRDLLLAVVEADPRGAPTAREAVGVALVARLAGTDEPAQSASGRSGPILAWLDGAGMSELVRALWISNPQPSLIQVAGQLRDNRALEPLVAACDSEHSAVRRAAIAALGDMQDSRAIGVLLHGTRDTSYAVRFAANRALEQFGMTAVIFGLAATIQPQLARGEAGELEPGAAGELDAGQTEAVDSSKGAGRRRPW